MAHLRYRGACPFVGIVLEPIYARDALIKLFVSNLFFIATIICWFCGCRLSDGTGVYVSL